MMHMRRKATTLLIGLTAMAALLMGGVVNAAPAAAATSCPDGYVCIYKGDVYDGYDYHPLVARYYYYGVYNLSNFYGVYSISNCQTGGANVQGFSGYNGTGSELWRSQLRSCPTGFVMNLTPTNSIRLYR
jgi:hypothetical protein